MQLVLELQPDELITLTRLLTPKKQVFYILTYFIILNLKWTGTLYFLTPEHKMDTIRTPNLHVYSLLDPMDTI